MLIVNAGEEHLFESFAEIAVIVADPHEAGLDDVGHNHFVFFVHIHAPFLATPKLKQVWLWLFGLTKTFDFLLL